MDLTSICGPWGRHPTAARQPVTVAIGATKRCNETMANERQWLAVLMSSIESRKDPQQQVSSKIVRDILQS